SNLGGVGDIRNALLLSGLQQQDTLVNNTASFQDAYAQFVARVGVDTNQAEINRDAQETLLEMSGAAREAVSGVNLDEEAANLIRFQQAYAAAAQVISIARLLFDTLIGAVQR
ncbi:MAG: flagellar hook-associated protein FlgK, partial [Alphaproteobacteria bacterium]|nr:flagellar hook-associated protein FlgK [Alphaproteobacteria bacterium]